MVAGVLPCCVSVVCACVTICAETDMAHEQCCVYTSLFIIMAANFWQFNVGFSVNHLNYFFCKYFKKKKKKPRLQLNLV